MEKEKIVQLLQYRRHDLVNDIQVIHGYASMQMLDKVQEKLDEFITATEHERKLHMLGAPTFILWVEMFRMQQENFKLIYEVNDYVDLKAQDEWLTNKCEKLFQGIQRHMNREVMYEIYMNIYKKSENKPYIHLTINEIDKRLYECLQIVLKQLEDSMCTFSYRENRLTCDFQIDGTIEG